MVSLLNNDHLTILIRFYNCPLFGAEVEALHFGDFTLVHNKNPAAVPNAPPPCAPTFTNGDIGS